MATLGDLVVKLSMDAAGFESDMGKAAYEAEQFQTRVVAAGVLAGNALTKLASKAGEMLGEFAHAVREAIDQADEMGKLSQRTGVAVEKLSALTYAAKLSDVSVQSLTSGLQRLNKAIDSNSKAFDRLGLDASTFTSADQALGAIADKFSKMEDGSEKAAIAMQLFGRAGEQLIPMLNQGAAGLEEAKKQAEALGIVLSADTARQAEEFNDSMTRMEAQVHSFTMKIAAEVLPTMTTWLKELNKGIEIFGSFGSALYNIGIGINPLRDIGGNIRSLSDDLEKMQARMAEQKEMFPNADFTRDIENIETLSKRLEFLKWQQREYAMSLVKVGEVYDSLDARAKAAGEAQKPKAAPTESEEGTRQFEARQKAMEHELDTAEKLTEVQRLRNDIDRGYYDEVSKAHQKQLLNLAAEIDHTRALTKARKDAADAAAQHAKDVEDADKRLKRFEKQGAEEERRNNEKALKETLKGIEDEKRAQEKADREAEREAEKERRKQEKIAADAERERQKQFDEVVRDRQRYAEIFEGGVANFLTDIVQGTKSVSQAFADMGKSIVESIEAIIAKKLATALFESLFGSETSGEGGIGEIMRSIIGGYFGSGGGDVGGVGASGGEVVYRQHGGPVSAGQMVMVGERGPEMFRAGYSGRIDPVSAGDTVHNNVNVSVNVAPTTDRRSADQVASSVGIAVQRAMRRTQ